MDDWTGKPSRRRTGLNPRLTSHSRESAAIVGTYVGGLPVQVQPSRFSRASTRGGGAAACLSKTATPRPIGQGVALRCIGCVTAQARSNRSRFITFVHAATKSCANFAFASLEA